jgi:hypothetical protein
MIFSHGYDRMEEKRGIIKAIDQIRVRGLYSTARLCNFPAAKEKTGSKLQPFG